jgi:hypothetical protein
MNQKKKSKKTNSDYKILTANLHCGAGFFINVGIGRIINVGIGRDRSLHL